MGLYVGLYSGSPPCVGPVTPFPMASLPPASSSCQQDTQRLLGHLTPSEPSHLFRLVLSHRLPRFIASSAIHFKKELENILPVFLGDLCLAITSASPETEVHVVTALARRVLQWPWEAGGGLFHVLLSHVPVASNWQNAFTESRKK